MDNLQVVIGQACDWFVRRKVLWKYLLR